METILLFPFIAGVIVLAVFYLKTLQDVLKEVSPNNRQVEPGNVWLMFIPVFNVIYPFILYPKICDSVKLEMMERSLEETGDYGRGIGITMPILGICGFIPYLNLLTGIANFILWIIFWSKMNGYKNTLKYAKASAGPSISAREDLLD